MMIELAERKNDGYVPMKEIADKQGISLKYLERIVPVLTKNNLLEGTHGKGGGYRLCRKPVEYSVGELLRLTEGGLSTVACLECNGKPCDKQQSCRTVDMWRNLNKLIDEYFDGITIADLMEKGN